MRAFITPIYDRTDADVVQAKATIAKWMQEASEGGSPATYDLKGCLNNSDLNRIESNTAFLQERLKELGLYFGTVSNAKTWLGNEYLTKVEADRIIRNVKTVRDAVPIVSELEIPDTILTYSAVNALEKVQYMVYNVCKGLQISARPCNTEICNQKIYLTKAMKAVPKGVTYNRLGSMVCNRGQFPVRG